MRGQKKNKKTGKSASGSKKPANDRDFQKKARKITGEVWRLSEPLCESEGLELVHIEYQREPRGRVFRLYIDRPGGVTLDDCTFVSRQLGDILDVVIEADEPYHLEVSSPGQNRPLGKKEDFARFSGCMTEIRTDDPIDGRKRFKGILQGISNNIVSLRINDETMNIPFEKIIRAKLVNNNGENGC